MKSFATLPQELYRSRPRAVQLSGRGRVLAVAAVLLCLAAPAVWMLLERQAHADRVERDALLQSSDVINGVVTRLKRDSKENKTATVYYRFNTDGNAYEAHSKIPMVRWRTLNVGGALPIRYVTANPQWNIPDGVAPGVMPAAIPYLIAPLPAVIGIAFFLAIRYQRRMLSDGRAALAVIKTVTKRRGQHGESIKTMRYEFPLLNGSVQTGSFTTNGKALDVGTSIAVLYVDEYPRRSRPYPLSLVRVAEGG
jgi:hypothetical protein